MDSIIPPDLLYYFNKHSVSNGYHLKEKIWRGQTAELGFFNFSPRISNIEYRLSQMTFKNTEQPFDAKKNVQFMRLTECFNKDIRIVSSSKSSRHTRWQLQCQFDVTSPKVLLLTSFHSFLLHIYCTYIMLLLQLPNLIIALVTSSLDLFLPGNL